MRHKKLEFHTNIMKEWNFFFMGQYKVSEVGQVITNSQMNTVVLLKSGFDGLDLNPYSTPVYLKFTCPKTNKEYILLQQEIIIIDDEGLFYKTTEDTLKYMSNGNLEEEIARIKQIR